MPDIFISYSREDRAVAARFAEGLKRDGLDVWWDAALRAGETFDTVIEQALAQAKAVIVLWSPRSVQSRWVRAEATQADQNGTLIPVTIEPCKRPIIFELTHTCDLSAWEGDPADPAWVSFVSDIREMVSRAPAARASVSGAAPPVVRRQAERRQVTVLNAVLSDTAGATPDMDPEDWQDILLKFHDIAAQAIVKHGGQAQPQSGGAIVGLFGVDQTQEDDTHRAILAALELVELAPSSARRGVGPLAARVGIDSGLMVAGAVGAPSFGPPMTQAALLQAQVPPEIVAISAATAALVGGSLQLEPLGPRAFKVTGLRPMQTRFDMAKARGLSPFIGRLDDIDILEDALAKAEAGDGQVIGVVADPGVGKSRLCFEFLERCRARGVRVIEGRAAAHGRNVPYLAILEVFRSFFDIHAGDDAAAARAKITTSLIELEANVGDAPALVADFLGVSDPGAPALRLDPDTRQRTLMGLMRHLIRRSGERQLTITLVEDLHWLDPASAQFIGHMVEARNGARGMLLLNYRPEYRGEWMTNPWCRQIRLGLLDRGDVANLLTGLLGPEADNPDLTAMIEARTAGNPFFIEEVIHNLAETGHLDGERGAYRLVSPIARIEAPTNVTTVVAARIDRLGPREKQVLQAAAVVGKHFSEQMVMAASGIGAAELSQALELLRRGDFITELSVFPAVEFAFRHPLTQEIALGSLVKERRRQIHKSIAAAIEAQTEGRIDERAALIAHHWEEAGEFLKAAQWHRQAADWVSLTDPNAAVWHWRKTRSLLSDLTHDPEVITLGVAACQNLLNLSWRFTSGPDEIKALYDEGQVFVTAIGDRATELKLSMVYGRACCSVGDLASYIDLATQIYEGAQAVDDIALKVNAAVYLVDACVYTARFTDAVRLAEETLAAYDTPIPRSEWIMGFNPYSALHFWHAASLTIIGRVPEGLAEFDLCQALMVQDETREAAVYLASWAATGWLTLGDIAQVKACADAVDAACTAMGDPPTIVAHRKICQTFLHLGSGQPAKAIETAQAALAIHRQGERQHAGMSQMFIAEAMLHTGDFDATIAMAREAIETCKVSLRANLEAQAQGVLARALLRRDGMAGHGDAAVALDQAARLIALSGAQSVAPSLAEWRAEAAAVAGDTAARKAHLVQAADLFEAIGAPLQAGRVRAGA